MMPILLLWFLVAPSLPGADADATLIAGRLRKRVVRMLGKVVFVGVSFWLICSAAGVLAVGLAAFAGMPGAAVLGLAIALGGAAGAAVWTLAVCLLEQAWLNALGMPRDWRGPWLAGDLAEHMGMKRRTIRVEIPKGPGSRRRPGRVRKSPPPAPLTEPISITPVDRWLPDETCPTEVILLPDASSIFWLAEPTDPVP